jgi:hypothetical protein
MVDIKKTCGGKVNENRRNYGENERMRMQVLSCRRKENNSGGKSDQLKNSVDV